MSDAAMTFAEIGAALGISRQAAQQHYRNAIRKLRKRPYVMATLRKMQRDLDRMVTRGEGGF